MANVKSREIFKRLKRGAELKYGKGFGASMQTGAYGGSRQKNRDIDASEKEPQTKHRSEPSPHAEQKGMVMPQGMAMPMQMSVPMGGFTMPETQMEHIEDLGIPTETGASIKKPKESMDKTAIKLTYPLVPKNPKPNETVFAYSVIRHEPALRTLMYHLLEPKLTDDEKNIIEEVKKDLEERLSVDVSKMGYIETRNILLEEVDKSLELLGFKLDPGRKDIVLYYIERDTLGFGKIDALMKDPNIEDLSCDGVKVPLYAYYRDPRVGSVRTNIFFEEPEELDGFIVKLSQKCNKTISIAEPLLDGTLTDGSRIQATLGSDISRKGSNFTIRKFSDKPLTPTHMLNYKTVNSLQLAYLWLAIDHGKSVLISGGTATGKTSMLNVLSLFIRPSLKIVSIEDTAEIRLPHEHWVPQVARTAMAIKGATGEVTLFDLLKASLRQRPDYIILGEVRGKEAFVLFQQMASIPGDEKVIVYNDGHTKAVPITALEDKKYKLPTMDPDTGKIKISEMKALVEHSPVNELFKITTKTGRQIVTTGNHSIFINKKGKIEASVVGDMKKGDNILVPTKLPCGFNDIDKLNLIETLQKIRVYSPKYVKMAQKKLGFERASKIVERNTVSKYYGVNNCALPVANFKKLMEEADIKYKPEDVEVSFDRGKSPKTKGTLDITPELLRLLGYHMSEGSIKMARKNNIITLYNKDKKILADMRKCVTKVTGSKITERKTNGFDSCTELRFDHKTVFELIRQCSGTKPENKKIPDFIFGLSQKKIGHFLSGLYAGDSTMDGNKFCYYTTSKELAQGVCNLLLSLSIFPHIKERKRKNRRTTDYEIVFYREEEMRRFLKFAKPIGKDLTITKKVNPRKDMIGDLYIDKIKNIERISLKKPQPVYDISVPGTQNFVGGFGGVMLHNTGHPSLATIHAASVPQLIDRLTTKPIDLPARLLENIDVVVFIKLSRLNDRIIRRAVVIAEVVGVKGDRPITRKIFEWDAATDTFKPNEKSAVIKDIAKRSGMTDDEIIDELFRRKAVLEWMQKRGMLDYRDVGKIIRSYYLQPGKTLEMIKSM